MSDGIELATAYVSLTVDGSQVTPGVKRALGSTSAAADRAGSQAGKSFGSRFAAMAKSPIGAISGLLGAGALIGIAKDSVQLEASFSKTMAQVQASTNAGGKAMDAMRAKAMKLGADTAFSASDAAGAMLELAKAGISTKDIMGGALAGTLTLAAAGDTDLATASTIASNAMNTFNLKGKDMASIAAALAGGANASSASVESLGMGLSQVGPAATNAGLTLNDTVAALSAFDAAGIKGSDAGTSLKTMLVSLVPQTKQAKDAMKALGLNFQDAHGNIVPLTNVAQQLHDKLSGLTQAQRISALATIFGSDASRAATVLMKQGASGLEKYKKATEDQGAAQKMAKANMSGTAGALEQLSGSIETAELALGQALAPTVQKVAGMLTNDVLPPVTDFIGQMQSGKGAGGQFADILKSLANTGQDLAGAVVDTAVPLGKDLLPAFKDGVDLAQKLAGFLDDIPDPLKKIGVEGGIAAVAFSKIAKATGFFGGKITGVRSTLTGYRTDLALTRTTMGQIGPVTQETAAAQQRMADRTAKLGAAAKQAAGVGGMLLLVDGMKKLDDQSSQTAGTVETTLGGALAGLAFGPWGALAGGVGGLLASLSKFKDTVANPPDINPLLKNNLNLVDSFDKVSGAVTEATRSGVTNELQKKGLLSEAQVLGFSPADLTDAILGVGNAAGDIKGKLRGIIQNPPAANAPDSLQRMYDAAVNLDVAMPGLTGKFKSQGAAARQAILSNRGYVGALSDLKKNLPKDLVTHIRTDHLKGTVDDIRHLQKQYDLTPKEVRTLARAEGIDPASKAIRALIGLAKDLDHQNPTVHVHADTQSATTHIADVFRQLSALNGTTAQTYVSTHHIGGPVSADHNASGTPYFGGGLTWTGENGPELLDLPRATTIYPAQRSKQIARQAAASAPVVVMAPPVDLSGMSVSLVLEDGAELSGYISARTRDEIAAAGWMADQARRAGGIG